MNKRQRRLKAHAPSSVLARLALAQPGQACAHLKHAQGQGCVCSDVMPLHCNVFNDFEIQSNESNTSMLLWYKRLGNAFEKTSQHIKISIKPRRV
ncbi:conserved hypothetical protein [Ricinus communis]|uniref:Uncharacterized protein n=1 Tax=Ricinus communis TaxID=3988 RepID=B9SD67_RICCO|nr:conserved hypothetical protein [Ricinus communis]